MKRRTTTLIKSPLGWHIDSAPVPHPVLPVESRILSTSLGLRVGLPESSTELSSLVTTPSQD
jgi:hypothetical protein